MWSGEAGGESEIIIIPKKRKNLKDFRSLIRHVTKRQTTSPCQSFLYETRMDYIYFMKGPFYIQNLLLIFFYHIHQHFSESCQCLDLSLT